LRTHVPRGTSKVFIFEKRETGNSELLQRLKCRTWRGPLRKKYAAFTTHAPTLAIRLLFTVTVTACEQIEIAFNLDSRLWKAFIDDRTARATGGG
jgi:hypothetical protein